MPPSKAPVCIIIPAYKPAENMVPMVRETLLLFNDEFDLKIVIVDDGSGLEYSSVFEEVQELDQVTVLRHAVNLGKGMALKTAVNHILLHYTCVGAVTMDADGQHLPIDALAVARSLVTNPGDLILGCRTFCGPVPWRSRCGNGITKAMTRFLIGKKISDTQTGLRGLPCPFMADLLKLKTCGYDFEMEMLCVAVSRLNITEVPISTVYLDKTNSNSHFNYLFDSIAIYMVLFRHVGNSVSTAAIDYAVFCIAYMAFGSVLAALVLGRILAVLFNFNVSKKLVFKSNGSYKQELRRYLALVAALAGLAYVGIMAMMELGFAALPAKLIVELTLFIVSFSVQRSLIFAHHKSASKGHPL